jgi:hypothetical protein
MTCVCLASLPHLLFIALVEIRLHDNSRLPPGFIPGRALWVPDLNLKFASTDCLSALREVVPQLIFVFALVVLFRTLFLSRIIAIALQFIAWVCISVPLSFGTITGETTFNTDLSVTYAHPYAWLWPGFIYLLLTAVLLLVTSVPWKHQFLPIRFFKPSPAKPLRNAFPLSP